MRQRSVREVRRNAMDNPHQFSWLREVGIPAIFVTLGAVLGFLASYFLEKRKEKREDRQAKQAKAAFLRAIKMELDALADQLDASMQEVRESTERVKSGSGTQLAGA